MSVLAIEDLDASRPDISARILPTALRWLPRYLVTNGITTVLFWSLFAPLQWVVGQKMSNWHWPPYAATAILLLPMLFYHVRLVFATYAAIVDDQPGLRSVMLSIRLAHRRWKMVVAAFAGSFLIVAPLAGPLYLLIINVHNPVVAGGFEWALVMAIRPLSIATLHMIYKDFRSSILSNPVDHNPFNRSERSTRSHMNVLWILLNSMRWYYRKAGVMWKGRYYKGSK